MWRVDGINDFSGVKMCGMRFRRFGFMYFLCLKYIECMIIFNVEELF